MKKLIVFTLAFGSLFSNTNAQSNDDLKISVPVKSVILYLDGAEVTQTKNVSINAGRTMLVFTFT